MQIICTDENFPYGVELCTSYDYRIFFVILPMLLYRVSREQRTGGVFEIKGQSKKTRAVLKMEKTIPLRLPAKVGTN